MRAQDAGPYEYEHVDILARRSGYDVGSFRRECGPVISQLTDTDHLIVVFLDRLKHRLVALKVMVNHWLESVGHFVSVPKPSAMNSMAIGSSIRVSLEMTAKGEVSAKTALGLCGKGTISVSSPTWAFPDTELTGANTSMPITFQRGRMS